MTEAIRVPEIGENVESGVVVAVHIKVGQMVAVDDTVIELETDKALVEIPSPVAGRVAEVLAEAGAQMKVGDVIARVDTTGDGVQPSTPSDDAGSTAETVEVSHRHRGVVSCPVRTRPSSARPATASAVSQCNCDCSRFQRRRRCGACGAGPLL